MTVEQFYRLADLLDTRPQELMVGSQNLSGYSLDYRKFKQLIMACIEFGSDSDGKITKTKLAKLVYLADFNYFYHYKRPITGALYRAIQRGPVADEYFRAIDQLFEEQTIVIEPKGAAMLISSVEKQTSNQLDDAERVLTQKICKRWRDKTTQEIVEFTHQQLPYLKTELGNIIEYKHILQEANSNLY